MARVFTGVMASALLIAASIAVGMGLGACSEEICEVGALGCECRGTLIGFGHCDGYYGCYDHVCVEPEGDWHSCGAVCEVLVACDQDQDSVEECTSICDAALKDAHTDNSQACGYVNVLLNSCLAELSCDEYATRQNHEPGSAYPCMIEDDLVTESCSWR